MRKIEVPPAGERPSLRRVGPGLLIAATGVGAGDLIAAAVSGSRYGLAVVWAVLVGAVLKFALNEGLARWQLASGTTLLEGWTRHLGRWVQIAFLVYLVIWSFVVAGALISACGIAAHALVPALSVAAWGVIHSLLAALLVLAGGYAVFESLIKGFIAVMSVTLIGCALLSGSPTESLGQSILTASVPTGSVKYILGAIGGVGGSVTLLSYGYWIREKRWEGPGYMRLVRFDLGVAYSLTAVFGVAVVVLAANTLHALGVEVTGNGAAIQMAGMVDQVVGPIGRFMFLVGFWGAVSTSMLGVWQGVPYLFSDFVALMREGDPSGKVAPVDPRSAAYRGFLLFLCLPPMILLRFDRPVELVLIYSVLGAMFMPFLAGTLLYLNSREAWVGATLRNGWTARILLVLCLLLFGYLFVADLLARF